MGFIITLSCIFIAVYQFKSYKLLKAAFSAPVAPVKKKPRIQIVREPESIELDEEL